MDIGLYNMKYPVRKMIDGVLPLVKDTNPNTISWLLVPTGLVTAWCYFVGAQGAPVLYLSAVFFVLLRMFLGTLDGLMAEHFQKKSPQGEIINRLTPELCDVMYLISLSFARPDWLFVGVGVIGIAWLTTFSGLIGLAAGKKIQSVGPVGQTDRLAALILFSILAFCSEHFSWGVDFLFLFLCWSLVGGIVTIILRLKRNLGD